MRLSADEISARETADETAREKERREWIQPHSQSQSRNLDSWGDAIELFGDL